jgi:DNA-directed RNA polymerase specialized sigma24 family protein
MDEASDEDLMARIAQGDERAFRVIARRYAPRAVGLARRITRNAADADEITQEALLRVWLNAPRWRPTAAFRTWFYRVVTAGWLPRSRDCPNASARQSCLPIMKVSATPRQPPCSKRPSPASKRCSCAQNARCAQSSAQFSTAHPSEAA